MFNNAVRLGFLLLAGMGGLHDMATAGELVRSIEGRYSAKQTCERWLPDADKTVRCKYPIQPDRLKISRTGHATVSVRITSMRLRWTSEDPTPFYCDFDGEAKAVGNQLIVQKDSDGYPVDGLRLIVDDDKIKVVDNKRTDHVGYYCGEHVSLDGLQFRRRAR